MEWLRPEIIGDLCNTSQTLENDTALLETTTTHFIESTAEDNQNVTSRACPMRTIIENCDINCNGASPVCTGTNQGFTFSSDSTGNIFVSSSNQNANRKIIY